MDDATKSWKETTGRGAVSAFEPETREDAEGKVVLSGIETYGDTIHVFVERKAYGGTFLPGYAPGTQRAVPRRSDSSTSITWSATSGGVR